MHVKPSGNSVYHQVYVKNFVCGADIAFMFFFFLWISEQTATFPVYNTIGMVFITEVDTVYSTMLCLERAELSLGLEFLGVSQLTYFYTHQHHEHTNSRWKSSRM